MRAQDDQRRPPSATNQCRKVDGSCRAATRRPRPATVPQRRSAGQRQRRSTRSVQAEAAEEDRWRPRSAEVDELVVEAQPLAADVVGAEADDERCRAPAGDQRRRAPRSFSMPAGESRPCGIRPSRSRVCRAGRSAGRSAPAPGCAKAATSLYSTREIAGPEDLDQADQQAAQHRARQRADAAQHRGGEGLDAGQEADEEVDRCRSTAGTIMPATAASAAPITKVSEMVRSTLTPSSAAIFMSCSQARCWRPSEVRGDQPA